MKALRPITTLADIVKSDTFAGLRPVELQIYMRIIAASEKRGRKLSIANSELGHSPVTVRTALQQLEALKLITLTYGEGDAARRVVEVL